MHNSRRSDSIPRKRAPGFHLALLVELDQSRLPKRRIQVDFFVGEFETVVRYDADDGSSAPYLLRTHVKLPDHCVQLLEHRKRLRAVRTGPVFLVVETPEI